MSASMKSSRRNVLRGLGAGAATLAPILRGIRAEAAGPSPSTLRTVIMFHANGSHPDWTPIGSGSTYRMSESLAPLEKVRSDILILRQLTLARGEGNPHRAANASSLSGRPAYETTAQTSDGPSVDQYIAERLPPAPLRSLELSVIGGPSIAEVNRAKLPAIADPLEAYQRIAGRITPLTGEQTGGSGARSLAEVRLTSRRSALDFVTGELQMLSRRLGASERAKLDAYLGAVRDLERSLSTAMKEGVIAGPGCRPLSFESPGAGSENWPRVSRLHVDVIATALACGITRVATLGWGSGQSNAQVPFVPGMSNWHSTSHANLGGPAGRQMIQLQQVLSGEFAYLVERLKSISDGNGTRLYDHTVALWGTQNGNTNDATRAAQGHDPRNTPFIVAGGGRRMEDGEDSRLRGRQPQRSLSGPRPIVRHRRLHLRARALVQGPSGGPVGVDDVSVSGTPTLHPVTASSAVGAGERQRHIRTEAGRPRPGRSRRFDGHCLGGPFPGRRIEPEQAVTPRAQTLDPELCRRPIGDVCRPLLGEDPGFARTGQVVTRLIRPRGIRSNNNCSRRMSPQHLGSGRGTDLGVPGADHHDVSAGHRRGPVSVANRLPAPVLHVLRVIG